MLAIIKRAQPLGLLRISTCGNGKQNTSFNCYVVTLVALKIIENCGRKQSKWRELYCLFKRMSSLQFLLGAGGGGRSLSSMCFTEY